MAMRVTQGIMYNSFVSNMNRTLSDYMETNMQSSSQKRINRPSDDPVAAGRILSSRSTLETISTYTGNIKGAMGWLGLADGVLASSQGCVTDIINRLKVLAEEGADGNKTKENRLEISYEIRQHLEQLINIANTKYAGSHIFGGHKTDQPAYREGLAATVMDDYDYDAVSMTPLTDAKINISDGKLNRTMILQPLDHGAADSVGYRYSMDGGATWQSAESVTSDPSTGMCTILAGGVKIDFPATVPGSSPPEKYMVRGVEPLNDPNSPPENIHSNENGTWMYIRPTAIYQGDDHDTQVSQSYSPAGASSFTSEAYGTFARDVVMRLDSITAGTPPVLNYSYSTDDGNNWAQATCPIPSGATELNVPVPGGYLKLDHIPVDLPSPAADDMGTQFTIHPHRADILYQIGENSTIAVNMIGKDIFGGLYDYARDGYNYPVAVPGEGNLFEVVGNLLAAAETGSQQGMQEGLAQLTKVLEQVTTKVAEVGGRNNRLTATAGALLTRQYSEEDNLSYMEDADLTELMTRLAQQQTAYNSVLKSSSMIMQMSLVNFL